MELKNIQFIYGTQKKGGSILSSKIGRPIIGSPKIYDIKVRVDEKTIQMLQNYCLQHRITKAEAIRKSIIFFLGSENGRKKKE